MKPAKLQPHARIVPQSHTKLMRLGTAPVCITFPCSLCNMFSNDPRSTAKLPDDDDIGSPA
jgi:hypothetical protein